MSSSPCDRHPRTAAGAACTDRASRFVPTRCAASRSRTSTRRPPPSRSCEQPRRPPASRSTCATPTRSPSSTATRCCATPCSPATSTSPTALPSPGSAAPRATSGPVRGPGLVGAVAALGVGVARHYLWGGKDGVADGMADGLRHGGAGRVDRRHRDPAVRSADRRGPDRPRGPRARLRRQRALGRAWAPPTRTTSYDVSRRCSTCRSCRSVPPSTSGPARSPRRRRSCTAPASSGSTGSGREPRRLWRRYLVGNPRFVMSALAPPPEHAGPGRPQPATGPARRAGRTSSSRPRSASCATVVSTSSRCSRTPTRSPAVPPGCCVQRRDRSTRPPAYAASSASWSARGPTSSICTRCSH